MKILRFHLHLKSRLRQLTLWVSMITFCGSQHYGADQGFGKNFHKNHGFIRMLASSSKIQSNIKKVKVTYPPINQIILGQVSINEWSLRDCATRLQVIPEGQIRNEISYSFEQATIPPIEEWKTTNEYKMMEFVSQLESLTEGQKFYLTLLLFSYAQNSRTDSLGGAIEHMGFDPEGNFFEIDTVDTSQYAHLRDEFRYLYDLEKVGDDDSLKRHHWAISLKVLQDKYGFKDLFTSDIKDLADIQMSDNPDPSLIFRMIPLIMAAKRHPERIKIEGTHKNPRLKIFYQDASNGSSKSPYLTKLEIEDFLLSDLEADVIIMKKYLPGLSKLLSDLEYSEVGLAHPLAEEREKKLNQMNPFSRYNRIQQVMIALRRAWNALSDINGQLGFSILQAKKEVRDLDRTEAFKLLTNLGEALDAAEIALKKTKELFTKYPELGEKADPDIENAKSLLYWAENRHQVLVYMQQRIMTRYSLRLFKDDGDEDESMKVSL